MWNPITKFLQFTHENSFSVRLVDVLVLSRNPQYKNVTSVNLATISDNTASFVPPQFNFQ